MDKISIAILSCAALLFFYSYQEEATIEPIDKKSLSDLAPAKIREKTKTGLIEQDSSVDQRVEYLIDPDAIVQQEDSSKSTMAKNHIRLTRLELNEDSREYKLVFKKPLAGSLSLLFVGSSGKTQLRNVQVSFLNKERTPAQKLNKKYFKNDWYRFESGGEPIVALTFEGQSLSESGTISLYTQKKL